MMVYCDTLFVSSLMITVCNNKVCHRRFKTLGLDMLLTAFSGPFFSKELALCAESGVRVYFEGLNYVVIGGQERYPKKPGT